MPGRKTPDDDAEAVLLSLEENGAFDELRQRLISRIRENEELQAESRKLILQSKRLPLPTDDKRTTQLAAEAIRRELTTKVRGMMVAAVWKEMCQRDSQVALEIRAEAHKALCEVYEERNRQKK